MLKNRIFWLLAIAVLLSAAAALRPIIDGLHRPAPAPDPRKQSGPAQVKTDPASTDPASESQALPGGENVYSDHICESSRELGLADPPMTGDDVMEYQQALTRLGYFIRDPKGVYGSSTAKAVRDFQKSRQLPVDGRLNRHTQEALARAFDAKVDANPADAPRIRPASVRILINLYAHQLVVLVDDKPYKTYPIAVGKRKTRSPIGEWKIGTKGIWGNGFGTRWMGLTVPWGIYGIHGTNKPWTIGSAASHGCFRMYNRHVEEIYPLVGIGTPVDVVGDLFLFSPALAGSYRKGSRSQGVVAVQLRLKQLGYLKSRADGFFGSDTEAAVKAFQAAHKLPEDGVVAGETKKKLGF